MAGLSGLLGEGGITPSSAAPRVITLPQSVIDLSLGRDHACAITVGIYLISNPPPHNAYLASHSPVCLHINRPVRSLLLGHQYEPLPFSSTSSALIS
jgi:hypothetical protein